MFAFDSVADSISLPNPQSGLALPWALLLIFDFAIFALTACKAFENGWDCREALMRVLLRDGTSFISFDMYILVFTICIGQALYTLCGLL